MRGNPVRVSPEVGYDLWAQTWDAQPSPIVALEERTLQPLLGPVAGRRFVEISCGTGRWLAFAREQGARAVGFDLSPAMLAEAVRKPGLLGRLSIADACRLPVRDARADVVLCALSLGHIPPAEGTLAELARLVAPGGKLVVTDFHPEASRAGWKRTFRKNDQVYEVENHPYSISGLRDQARAQGLILEQLLEPYFGEPERKVFEQRGKADLFFEAAEMPAVVVAIWRLPGKPLPGIHRLTTGAASYNPAGTEPRVAASGGAMRPCGGQAKRTKAAQSPCALQCS